MENADPLSEFDAHVLAGGRVEMPTTLSTAELRELGPMVLARSVFSARASSAIFVSKIKEVTDLLTAGKIGEGQARTLLGETLRALGYTPEGGFPDAPAGSVPPAVRGSLQDLSSFRRLDLIVRTQLDLMTGAGEQFRGHKTERLAQFPAWELVRVEARQAPRDWPGRFVVAGGKLTARRMIAFKGDPVWGELGSYDNFPDALGVDYPPFAFLSGMRWKEISAADCDTLGVRGPNGETADEWFAKRPVTMGGKLPMPSPKISMEDVDPAVLEQFQKSTHATPDPAKPMTFDYSDLMESELAAGRAAYQKSNPGYQG